MAGIKETIELLDLVEQSGVAAKAAMADGKIDWRDALNKETRDLLPKLQAAVAGGNLVPLELKDIDGAEAQALYTKLVGVVTIWVSVILG